MLHSKWYDSGTIDVDVDVDDDVDCRMFLSSFIFSLLFTSIYFLHRCEPHFYCDFVVCTVCTLLTLLTFFYCSFRTLCLVHS